MFSMRGLLTALVALTCLVAPAHARASASAAHDLRAFIDGSEVRAGEIIEIHWKAPGIEVPELEILLSLDGGAHYPLRVSPELDPLTGRFRWRVPNLSSADARLRIRFGHGASECWGEPSGTFRIIGAPGAADFDQICESGWWSGLNSAGPDPRAGAFDSSSERIERGTAPVTSAIVPSSSFAARPIRYTATRELEPVCEIPAPPRAGSVTPPLMVMRN